LLFIAFQFLTQLADHNFIMDNNQQQPLGQFQHQQFAVPPPPPPQPVQQQAHQQANWPLQQANWVPPHQAQLAPQPVQQQVQHQQANWGQQQAAQAPRRVAVYDVELRREVVRMREMLFDVLHALRSANNGRSKSQGKKGNNKHGGKGKDGNNKDGNNNGGPGNGGGNGGAGSSGSAEQAVAMS
jgi:hypothetical protein